MYFPTYTVVCNSFHYAGTPMITSTSTNHIFTLFGVSVFNLSWEISRDFEVDRYEIQNLFIVDTLTYPASALYAVIVTDTGMQPYLEVFGICGQTHNVSFGLLKVEETSKQKYITSLGTCMLTMWYILRESLLIYSFLIYAHIYM